MDAQSGMTAGVDDDLDTLEDVDEDGDDTNPLGDLAADLGDLLAAPTPITVAGIPCVVRRIRTIEFLGAVRVLTVGAGAAVYPLLGDLRSIGGNRDKLAQAVVALMLTGATSAPVAMCDWIQTMVDVDPRAVTDKKQRRVARARLDQVLRNPPVDVLPAVIEHVVYQEADTLFELLGKAIAAAQRAFTNGQAIAAAKRAR